ncbi:hypothetical protein [Clostridium estertheticum]|uniref:hypothetical protein n=1 Tax=Clostridium estertheticum TaxID=238834 RepID=UPI001C6E1C87|nr:hypothetical protein [Clostridium estertheticum]MBW9154726.1 hypothetical protein [Clostridium estertheticum]WLC82774.1 hypothetical protein KTC97_11580 [Clostridium estertheticum]
MKRNTIKEMSSESEEDYYVFKIEGMWIFIKDEEIRVECNGKSYGFSRGEFDRKPRGVVGRIIDIGRVF